MGKFDRRLEQALLGMDRFHCVRDRLTDMAGYPGFPIRVSLAYPICNTGKRDIDINRCTDSQFTKTLSTLMSSAK